MFIYRTFIVTEGCSYVYLTTNRSASKVALHLAPCHSDILSVKALENY